MSSILSFPDRGPWGKSNWRGNCSGHVIKSLFEQLKPKSVVDCTVGSGTTVDVAKTMGIPCVGLDLHMGFNAVSDSIAEAAGGPADLVLSHPPYADLIVYSNEVWGDAPNPHDLSRCKDVNDFNEKMQLVLLNQRDATNPGGHYATIIGDFRRSGEYTSLQAEFIARMPSDELAAVIIKAQHNTMSGNKQYANMKYPLITHEYVLVWRKRDVPVLVLLSNMAKLQYSRLTGTWKNIVKMALMKLGGNASLTEIYSFIEKSAPAQLASNENWKAKIRQILNSRGEFISEERGVWKMAA